MRQFFLPIKLALCEIVAISSLFLTIVSLYLSIPTLYLSITTNFLLIATIYFLQHCISSLCLHNWLVPLYFSWLLFYILHFQFYTSQLWLYFSYNMSSNFNFISRNYGFISHNRDLCFKLSQLPVLFYFLLWKLVETDFHTPLWKKQTTFSKVGFLIKSLEGFFDGHKHRILILGHLSVSIVIWITWH